MDTKDKVIEQLLKRIEFLECHPLPDYSVAKIGKRALYTYITNKETSYRIMHEVGFSSKSEMEDDKEYAIQLVEWFYDK